MASQSYLLLPSISPIGRVRCLLLFLVCRRCTYHSRRPLRSSSSSSRQRPGRGPSHLLSPGGLLLLLLLLLLLQGRGSLVGGRPRTEPATFGGPTPLHAPLIVALVVAVVVQVRRRAAERLRPQVVGQGVGLGLGDGQVHGDGLGLAEDRLNRRSWKKKGDQRIRNLRGKKENLKSSL